MRKNKKILIIHGPNLHMLGVRERDIYGEFTLQELDQELREKVAGRDIQFESFQSNSEGKIVDKITQMAFDCLIINPAAYTHTSVAIRDALLAVKKPTIEVHLSNIYARDQFRKHSYISDIVTGSISGFGKLSYFLAVEAAVFLLDSM